MDTNEVMSNDKYTIELQSIEVYTFFIIVLYTYNNYI